MSSNKSRLSSMVVALAVGLMCAPVTAFAQYCMDFNAETPGTRPNPWSMTLGSGFPAAQMQLSALGTSSGLEVWSGVPSLFATTSVRVWGYPSDLKIIGLVPSGFTLVYPSSFDLDVLDMNHDATVAAYDPSGKFLGSQIAYYNTITHVSFSGLGQIGYIYISGNQNEMWVDNICFQ